MEVWLDNDVAVLPLFDLDLDAVRGEIVITIGGFEEAESFSLEEQIDNDGEKKCAETY